jgi:hypothetical protein
MTYTDQGPVKIMEKYMGTEFLKMGEWRREGVKTFIPT